MNHEKIKDLETMLNRDCSNITGIAVLKDGKTLYENYFNGCTTDSKIHIYSVTKSMISILIGIAIDKGYIKSIEQNVLEFFPDYTVKRGEKTIQQITLKHLLTMTAPYKYKFAPYVKYFTSNDGVKFSLDQLGGRGKIGTFRYTPLIGPDILSGILVKATGQSVFDFAAEHLFRPMNITVERNLMFDTKEEHLAFNKATNISGWVTDAAGTNTAGWGLTLSTSDLAKLGQLYLDMGVYKEKQIVSPKWICESTREHSRWDKFDLAYGYLWWIHKDGFAAMGDGGNVIYVNEKNKIVVSITALFKPKVEDRIEFIQTHIEPIFGT